MALHLARHLCVAAVVGGLALPVMASEDNRKRPVFDWFANAAPTQPDAEAAARKKAALIKARALANGATWVCTPAGSGKKASCTEG